jgi:flavin reductase (DIM6/NTAB) family NADH-FMN oxidoreductase RutF
VNLVEEPLAEAMNRCAAALPYGENKLARAGLALRPSHLSRKGCSAYYGQVAVSAG